MDPSVLDLTKHLRDIADRLHNNNRDLDSREAYGCLTWLAELSPTDIHLNSANFKSGKQVGRLLTKAINEIEPALGDLKADGLNSDKLSELSTLILRAPALKRLDLLSDLLGTREKIELQLHPATTREVGQWGMIYNHSHHMLNKCVSGQIIAESGRVQIETYISDSEFCRGAFCYLITVTTEYSPQKSIQMLINAEPDNITKGQVADWSGPLSCGLGIFFNDPYLGGRYTSKDRLQNGFIQQAENHAITKSLRDFTNGAQEEVADWIIKAILERRKT